MESEKGQKVKILKTNNQAKLIFSGTNMSGTSPWK